MVARCCTACGMTPLSGLSWLEWHTAHRDQHPAVFADIDQGTVDNLQMAIDFAARHETKAHTA